MDDSRHPDTVYDLPLASEPDEATLAGAEQLLCLPRLQPPAGFAERVLARAGVTAPPTPAVRHHWRPRRFARRLGLALAAVLTLAVTLPTLWLQHQRAVEGRAAAQQFELAMRLTQRQIALAGQHAASWHAGTSRYVELHRN